MKTSWLLLSFIILLLLAGIYLLTGEEFLSPSQLVHACTGGEVDAWIKVVVWEIRLPRMLVILLTGAGLALAGMVMQMLLSNPMADPYLLGTSSGASLGAAASTLLSAGLTIPSLFFSGLTSFVVALLTSLLCLSLAGKGKNTAFKLVLSGLAVSSFTMALVSILIYLTPNQDKIRQMVFWMLGSFDAATWPQVAVLATVVAISFAVVMLLARHLNVMMLGTEKASQLGVNVVALRWVALSVVVLVTSFSVSIVGPVGFVGLMVPHIVRLIYPEPRAVNFAITCLWGAAMLLLADWIGRLIVPSTGLPASLIMSIGGVPFLLWLMNRKLQ